MDADEALAKFLKECLGVSPLSPIAVENDSDWTVVIRLQAYLEATLNYLIIDHFGDKRLAEVVSRMEIGDRKRGKLAFVKALDLLPSDHRSFVQKFSELRNILVHGIRNLDFDVENHLENLDAAQRKEIKNAVIPILKEFIQDATDDSCLKMWNERPREALFSCVASIMLRVYARSLANRVQLEDGLMPEKSNPKAP